MMNILNLDIKTKLTKPINNMRNSHKELVREEMKLSGKYCKDLCNLSIADISSTIHFCHQKILESGNFPKSAPNQPYISVINEFTEYMEEFTGRVSNRTADFKIKEENENILKSSQGQFVGIDIKTKKEALETLKSIDGFLKTMRVQGYFGNSPQSQDDLDNQQVMIDKIREVRDFIQLTKEI